MATEVPRPRHRWFAATYDVMGRAGEKQMAPLRRRLLHDLHGDVLEVGCGTGASFEYYDWDYIETLEATEPDPFMARRAREKIASLDEDARARVRLTEAPAEALPFEDGRFDAVVSCLVLCTVSDLQRSLGEMRRVLKQGGELRLLEHVAGDGARRMVQGAVQPVYGWFGAGCQLTRRTEEAVREAGFELEVWERMRFTPLHPGFLGVARKAASP
jgi:ubiquinone/menaquinone biosynthesis C-methylase UbiE